MIQKAGLMMKALNIGIALVATWLILLTAMLMFSRETYEETSRWIHGTDSPLMASAFLDFIVTPAFGVLLIGLAVICATKELFIPYSPRKKALLNTVILFLGALVFIAFSQALIAPR